MPQPTMGDGQQPGGEAKPSWDTSQKQAGGGQPGGEEQPAGGGQPGGEEQPAGGAGGAQGEESWESGAPGEDDGWSTSNQLPGATADIPPMPTERNGGGGGGQDGEPGTPGSDSELDKALEDFDGDILAEREVIQARANETAGNNPVPGELPGSSGQSSAGGAQTGGDATTPGGAVSGPGGMPTQRSAPPAPTAGGTVPEDLPDARDDDVIARQLREAAMNETDPALKEKLWEEYRRYKGK